MFRILGDEIEYFNRPFARIVAPVSTTRDYAEDEIWSWDTARREAEDQAWKTSVESGYREEIDSLERRLEELRVENETLTTVLNEIEDGDTCLDLIAKARAETAEWRKIAEANRAAYLEAVKPKPRKRKVA